MIWLGMLIGLFIGSAIGFLISCLIVCAKNNDNFSNDPENKITESVKNEKN